MLTIGEFSKISHISSRMLRHYNQIGILKPVFVDEMSGYRYYEPNQLKKILLIEKLKGYGFSLNEVSQLLELSDFDLNEKIRTKVILQYQKLNQLRRKIREMEEEIFKIEGDAYMKDKYKIVVIKNKSQEVFGIRKTINIGQVGELFDELLQEVKNRGLVRTGVCQLVYNGEEFSYDNMDVEAQVEVSGIDNGIKEIPETSYVSTIHVGPYDGLKNGYDAICNWFAENPNYKVVGPSVERYLKDVDMVNDDEELETAILFPVIYK